MSKDMLIIDGRPYEPTPEEAERVAAIRAEFLRECDQIAAEIGDDGRFHGFNNAYDPYADARARFQERMRDVVSTLNLSR